MRKFTLTVLLGIFMIGCAYSQMSFNGSKLTKSAFDLTASSDEQTVKENSKMDMKIVITNEEEETMKRRRHSRGGDFSNSIKTNPLSMIFGYYGLTYERKIADQMSVGLTLGLYSRSTGVTGMEYSYSGFTVNPEFRYYFESAIEGFYVSPYIVFTSITETLDYSYTDFNTGAVTSTKYTNKYTVFGAGAGVGRQWIWGGFTLDLFAGIGYTSASETVDSNLGSGVALSGGLSFSGVLPSFGAAIGYSF